MSHPSGTSHKKDDNHSLDETQQLINAALDSALDELDSDSDDDDEEHETFSDCISNEHEIHNNNNNNQNEEESSPQKRSPSNHKTTTSTINTGSNDRPIQGPPKPPVTSSSSHDVNNNMDQLFTSMMEQLMNMNHTDDGGGTGGTTTNAPGPTTTTTTNTANANIDPFIADIMSKNINDDEVLLGRFMQEIQTRLQSELFPTVSTDTASSSPPQATSTTTPKRTTPVSQPPLTTASNVTSSSSYNNSNNNNSEVESVISNLVSNLSQTMNRHMNDDNEDDDISELDDLPDMDNVIRKTVEDDDDHMAVLLQKLMGNLMNHSTNTDAATTTPNKNNKNHHNPDHNAADTILDGMMEQLLCKDIMYEPMKQVASKFPTWLQQQQSVLSTTEYDRRCQQNECFQKIVQIYETEPINMKQLIGLMQEVQEYGQPPTDIIQAIAPGIELDDNGIPTMNPTTSTTFPPFGTNKDDDCRIM